MKKIICILVLSVFIAFCRVVGFAQSVAPSVNIGTHKLALGMPEATVLEQLGDDLHLSHGKNGVWFVSKKDGELFTLLGFVDFTDHKLSSAVRSFEVKESSSKTLFYAINAASKSLEHEGLTDCLLRTSNENYPVDGGSVESQAVELDCGIKKVKITLSFSDAPDVATNIRVTEWLQSK